MLNESEKTKEIERRKSAGHLKLPFPKEDEVIRGFFSTEHRLYLCSQYGIYQAITSDDIDPDVTQANVPWVINRYLSYGTRRKLFAFIIGLESDISKVVISNQDVNKTIRDKLLPTLVAAGQIEYAKDVYKNEIEQHSEFLDGLMLKDIKEGSGLQIPTIDNFEVCFNLFFLSIKRYLIGLFTVCEWACGLPEGKGAKLDRLINRIESNKISKKMGDLSILNRHVDFVRFCNEVRNAYEHPSASTYVELRNVSFVPPNGLSKPEFRLIKNENSKEAQWMDFELQMTHFYDVLCSLTRDVFIVNAWARGDTRFTNWRVLPIKNTNINVDMPVDCKFESYSVSVADNFMPPHPKSQPAP